MSKKAVVRLSAMVHVTSHRHQMNHCLFARASVEVDWFYQNLRFVSVDHLHCQGTCATFSKFTFNQQHKTPDLETDLQNPSTCLPILYCCTSVDQDTSVSSGALKNAASIVLHFAERAVWPNLCTRIKTIIKTQDFWLLLLFLALWKTFYKSTCKDLFDKWLSGNTY